MANPNGNIKNFKPLSAEEARKRGRAGGLASVKARLERKSMREWAVALRDLPSEKKADMTKAQAAILAAWNEAEKGDIRAHRFLSELMGEMETETNAIGIIAPPIILGTIPQEKVEKAKADHEKRQLEK